MPDIESRIADYPIKTDHDSSDDDSSDNEVDEQESDLDIK